MGRFLIFCQNYIFPALSTLFGNFFGKDFVFKINRGFIEKFEWVFFHYDLGYFTVYPPGRKKRKVSTRGPIEFSFNYLYMNIYTPEI